MNLSLKIQLVVRAAAVGLTLMLSAGCGDSPAAGGPDAGSPPPSPLAELGRLIFHDPSLSSPPGQSCATCHDPDHAFTDGRPGAPTSQGAVAGRFGRRNAPSAMYLGACPPLHYSDAAGTLIGGLFLDGRVQSLAQQATHPLLGALEMNNVDPAAIVTRLRAASYAPRLVELFGPAALDRNETALDAMAQSVSAFEQSDALQPFTSKYDRYLEGRAALTDSELRGLRLFEDPAKGNCAACHPSRPADGAPRPLFTDFSYDNLGIPRNPASPFYALPADLNPDGAAAIDRGLGATLGDPAEAGKFRVPSLRNVALTAPYGHNGYFADLRSIVDFYNTRDDRPDPWPAPEVPGTVNRDELGRLGLRDDEVADLVAFLGALTDGYAP